MPRPAPDYPLQLLLKLLDEGFDTKAWHGPNLRGALRRVDAATKTGLTEADKTGRSDEWEPRPCEETWWQTRQGRVSEGLRYEYQGDGQAGYDVVKGRP